MFWATSRRLRRIEQTLAALLDAYDLTLLQGAALMSAYDELKSSVADLGAKFDAFLAAMAQDVQARIDAELAKDEALDNAGLEVLKSDVVAIMNRIPPVLPDVEISNH